MTDSENLLASVRKRLQTVEGQIDVGSLNVLSAKYEVSTLRNLQFCNCYILFFLQSLDYDTCENHLVLEEERNKGYKFLMRKSLARWFIFLLIGMTTALIACAINISIEELSEIKYAALSKCILFQQYFCIMIIPFLFLDIENSCR